MPYLAIIVADDAEGHFSHDPLYFYLMEREQERDVRTFYPNLFAHEPEEEACVFPTQEAAIEAAAQWLPVCPPDICPMELQVCEVTEHIVTERYLMPLHPEEFPYG